MAGRHQIKLCPVHQTERCVDSRGNRFCRECKTEAQKRRRASDDNSLHPDYGVWQNMKNRCFNKNVKGYKHYGGRGITVCERWLNSFENFISDMGSRPEPRHLYSIERKDSNGHYEKDNCKWATKKEQSRNTSRNHYIDFEGERVTIAEAAERSNLTYATLIQRIRYYPINYNEEKISIRKAASISGLRLEIVKRRAKLCTDFNWIASPNRGAPTYIFESCFYTIDELSILSGIDPKTLFDELYRKKITAEELIVKQK